MDKEEQNLSPKGSDERRADESDQKEQAAKDLEDSTLAGGAPEPTDSKQGNVEEDHSESREEEGKGLVDKVKDKLKGE